MGMYLVIAFFSYGVVRVVTSTPRAEVMELSSQEGFISARTQPA
jgi:hypothetical protein